MHVRKIISVWALLALMIAQIAVAQHSAAHFDHGFDDASLAQISDHDNEKNEKDDSEDTSHRDCPEYLHAKALQAAFISDGALNYTLQTGTNSFYISETPYVSARKTKPYNPRAPPAFLI